MEHELFFTTLCNQWKLGKMTAPPQPVSGGYLHRMYRLDTASASYAVKLLNPEIMKRESAMNNFLRAEALEGILEQNGLPIVAAMSQDGKKIHTIEGQHYYLFPWMEAKALRWGEITALHCRIIGGLLARIHELKPSADAESVSASEPFSFNWQNLAYLAQERCPQIASLLADNLLLLYNAQDAYRQAVERLPNFNCICNSDMDCKNVLWQGNEPLVIDLECLEMGNPILDLIQLALSWAGGAECELDMERLAAFLNAYREYSGPMTLDWEKLSGIGFAWLDWLNYNVRRACGIECMDKAEQRMGIEQACQTMERIRYYASARDEIGKRFAASMG